MSGGILAGGSLLLGAIGLGLQVQAGNAALEGRQQAAEIRRQQLQQRQLLAQQAIDQRRVVTDSKRELAAQETTQEQGRVSTAGAALGHQLGVKGSPTEVTIGDLGARNTLADLFRIHDDKAFERQKQIEIAGIGADLELNRLGSVNDERSNSFRNAALGVNFFSKSLSRFDFDFKKKQLKFRQGVA